MHTHTHVHVTYMYICVYMSVYLCISLFIYLLIDMWCFRGQWCLGLLLRPRHAACGISGVVGQSTEQAMPTRKKQDVGIHGAEATNIDPNISH